MYKIPDFFVSNGWTFLLGEKRDSMRFFVKEIISRTVITPFLLVSLFASPARASEAALTDIVVTNTRGQPLLYFSITNCFTEDMKEAIHNGIMTTFTFFIKLYEIKGFWWDKKIADLKVSHDIQYDSLKKVYRVRLSERNNKMILVRDFQEAKKLASEIVDLEITGLHNLHKGSRYQVRMMAELDKITLPFYLHYVFFFLSLWDFETDWYRVDFKY